MTCVPKRMIDLIQCGQSFACEVFFDEIHEAQCRCLRQRCARSALDQSSRDFPLPEPHRIRQRRATANHRAGRFDVRACVEKRVQQRHVIAACGPMQRCFCMRAVKSCVHVRASLNERDHCFSTVWKISGPVSHDVQQ